MHLNQQRFFRRRARSSAWLPACLVALGLAAASAAAASSPPLIDFDNLDSMSLEELGDVRITSVSKRSERLADAPAAVFVINSDDVRRSGATSLREALRLAPNLQVNRASNSDYVITARGFANSDGNKLLVLIDGRSVYTPLSSGVSWDAQDVAIDDIERIEVISGPGGTLWGTNAVNGVINVITKSAAATQGGLLVAGAGNRLRDASVRQGGLLGDHGAYRVYAKAFDERHSDNAFGAANDDAWHKQQIGFRADWQQDADQFTLQGDTYRALRGQPEPGSLNFDGVDLALGRITLAGANLMALWRHQDAAGGSLNLQAYYDRSERTVPPTYAEKLDIVDFQAQYALAPIGPHTLVLGAQYRHAQDHLVNSEYIAFLPANLGQSWSSLFAQDEIALSQSVKLTLGARFERNDYTGMEVLPTLRLAWKTAPDSLLWGALSRTVRAPSRLDRDTFVPGQPPYLLYGTADFLSERADVLEIGYRTQLANRWSYSVNAYRARYDRLRTQELAPSGEQVFYGNGMKGATTGIELWGNLDLASNWRLSGGYTALLETLQLEPGSIDTANSLQKAGRDPSHTWVLRSALQLNSRTDVDLSLRRVAGLSNPEVPAYTALDMRLGWRMRPAIEVSLSGQNLIGPGHGEFTNVATRMHVGRTVLVSLASKF